MIEARLRGRLLRIGGPALRITFFRTFVALTCIRLIIGLWVVRHQLFIALAGGGDFAVLTALLLLGFAVFVSGLYGLVAAAVVAVVIAAIKKLYVPHA